VVALVMLGGAARTVARENAEAERSVAASRERAAVPVDAGGPPPTTTGPDLATEVVALLEAGAPDDQDVAVLAPATGGTWEAQDDVAATAGETVHPCVDPASVEAGLQRGWVLREGADNLVGVLTHVSEHATEADASAALAQLDAPAFVGCAQDLPPYAVPTGTPTAEEVRSHVVDGDAASLALVTELESDTTPCTLHHEVEARRVGSVVLIVDAFRCDEPTSPGSLDGLADALAARVTG
jgi:hypothetical protein